MGIEAPGWNTGAAFFDADGDGWLDLYIAQYIDCTLEDVLHAKRTLWWPWVLGGAALAAGLAVGGYFAFRPREAPPPTTGTLLTFIEDGFLVSAR